MITTAVDSDRSVCEYDGTIIGVWLASGVLSCGGINCVEENEDVIEASKIDELVFEQAKSVLTASNISILAFPLVATFVSLAFIAELRDIAKILYLSFKDVISTLHLLVKGADKVAVGTS